MSQAIDLSPIQSQALALAALLQCAVSVENLAERGVLDDDAMGTALRSLFTFDPSDAADAVGAPGRLRDGLRTLSTFADADLESARLRYAMGLLKLARNLKGDQRFLGKVHAGLDTQSGEWQARWEGSDAGKLALIQDVAEVYTATLSKCDPRIMVTGDRMQLEDPNVVARIRCLLLAGFRAGILWYQVGGSIPGLLWRRSAIADAARRMLLEA
jgi:high frequency lysogenization protein